MRPDPTVLTPREQAVAELDDAGLRTGEIANRLGVRPRTIASMLAVVREKRAVAPNTR